MAENLFIFKALDSQNVAEKLDDDVLADISMHLSDTITNDEESRQNWLDKTEEWVKLATQVTENKTHPWPGAANVKYPLLTTAAMQFHARAYPALVNNKPVSVKTIGPDPEGEKRARADRIGTHMSFQLLHAMPDWDEHMDRLCMILPIIGLAFKKTYYSSVWNGPVSELVMPKDLIVNYHAKSFEQAPRKTHILPMHANEIIENIRVGHFLDIDLEDLGTPKAESEEKLSNKIHGLKAPNNDEDQPYILWECHCFLDLDEDGYKEPYIVTMESESGTILNISARFDDKTIITDDDGNLQKIIPHEHFTRFMFIPDPDSNIYALGFGHLLGPTNEASNTIINQLLDAGTLSNMQSGFLAKGIRLKGGSTRFRPGEWKFTQTSGEDLQKGVYPLPVREPSNVLFQLLSLLLDSGQQMASVTDIMVGESPGQNQPASTTMAVMEQGQKIFTGIFKRVYRSLGGEFKKLFYLNWLYPDEERYFNLLGLGEEVYHADYDVYDLIVQPSADPESVTDAQKMVRAEALWPLVQMGTVNAQEATRRNLEAQGHEDVDNLMQMPEPQPDPEFELERAKFEHQRALDWARQEMEVIKAQAMALRNEASALQNIAQAKSVSTHDSLDVEAQRLNEIKTQEEMIQSRLKALSEAAQQEQDADPGIQEPGAPEPRPDQLPDETAAGPQQP